MYNYKRDFSLSFIAKAKARIVINLIQIMAVILRELKRSVFVHTIPI